MQLSCRLSNSRRDLNKPGRLRLSLGIDRMNSRLSRTSRFELLDCKCNLQCSCRRPPKEPIKEHLNIQYRQ